MIIEVADYSRQIHVDDLKKQGYSNTLIESAVHPKSYNDLLCTAEVLGYKKGRAYHTAKSYGWWVPEDRQRSYSSTIHKVACNYK